jgi:hypothetical protein
MLLAAADDHLADGETCSVRCLGLAHASVANNVMVASFWQAPDMHKTATLHQSVLYTVPCISDREAVNRVLLFCSGFISRIVSYHARGVNVGVAAAGHALPYYLLPSVSSLCSKWKMVLMWSGIERHYLYAAFGLLRLLPPLSVRALRCYCGYNA